MYRKLISAERLHEVLSYDPETGAFTYRLGKRAGRLAGCRTDQGYRRHHIDGVKYKGHRLAWLYMTGEWPIEIDHKNCKRDDNRFSNLREANRSQNLRNSKNRRNNTSGLKGTSFHKSRGKWRATISHAGRQQHLGHFDTPEEAHAAYCAAAIKIEPAFARFA